MITLTVYSTQKLKLTGITLMVSMGSSNYQHIFHIIFSGHTIIIIFATVVRQLEANEDPSCVVDFWGKSRVSIL